MQRRWISTCIFRIDTRRRRSLNPVVNAFVICIKVFVNLSVGFSQVKNKLRRRITKVSVFAWSTQVVPSALRTTHIKQLLDEVEHDIMNYQNRGLCYLPKPKAEADNTDTRF